MNKILKHRGRRIGPAFLMTVSVLLLLNCVSVYAATVEIVYMTPHYRHPVTAAIEDAGQNEDIGQGMTESVLFPQALLETDDAGRIYLTTRNKLAQHISSMKFAVQKRGEKGYTPVPYQVTATGEDFKDTRFQIPSKDSVIRMEFYVEPMGRTVIFYGSMGKIVPGNTDFKILVNVGAAQNIEVLPAAGTEQDGEQPVTKGVSDEEPGDAQIAEQTTGEAGKAIGFDHGLLTRNSPEVRRLLGKDTEESSEVSSGAPYGEVTKFMLQVLSIIIGTLTAALMLSAMALPLYYRTLRDKNNRREASLYAREDKLKGR